MFAYRRTVRTGTPVFSAIFAYGTGQTEWREAKIFIARLFRYAQYGSPSRLSAVVTSVLAPLSPPIRRSACAIGDSTALKFIKENNACYVSIESGIKIKSLADEIIATGVKTADAHHVASAIIGNATYFLTTDNRLLKYHTDRISLIDPTFFIRQLEKL